MSWRRICGWPVNVHAVLAGAAAVLLVVRVALDPQDWIGISTNVVLLATNVCFGWRFRDL